MAIPTRPPIRFKTPNNLTAPQPPSRRFKTRPSFRSNNNIQQGTAAELPPSLTSLHMSAGQMRENKRGLLATRPDEVGRSVPISSSTRTTWESLSHFLCSLGKKTPALPSLVSGKPSLSIPQSHCYSSEYLHQRNSEILRDSHVRGQGIQIFASDLSSRTDPSQGKEGDQSVLTPTFSMDLYRR